MFVLALADRDPAHGLITSILGDGQGTNGRKVDAVVTLGDLNSSFLTELRDFPDVPLVGVYGNHCLDDYLPSLGGKCLHRKGTHINGVSFAGLSGCPRYKNRGEFQYYPEDVEEWLTVYPQVDVLLTHCPPRGVNDDPTRYSHQGWASLANYVHTKPPKYLLHGHTNPPYPYGSEEPVVTQLRNGTQVRWVFGHALLELDV